MDVSLITYLGDQRLPRGMRNNNPGNIYITKKAYLGKIPISKRKDRQFEQFEKYWHGVYNLTSILHFYYFDKKANTIEKLVNKFARPGQLLKPITQSITKATGIRPRKEIHFTRENIYLIVCELTRYENNRNTLITPDLFAYVWLKLFP